MGRLTHRHEIPWFSVIIFACLFLVFKSAPTNTTEDWISDYEVVLKEAAKDWRNKDYARALDGFSSAQIILKNHVPVPSEVFEWKMFLALRAYTLLLARLVEIDIYDDEENTERVTELVNQATDWADVLKKQSKEWAMVNVEDPDRSSFRKRWLDRFSKAVNHVLRLSRKTNSSERS